MYTGSMVGAGFGPYAVMGYVISNQKPDSVVGFQVELNPALLTTIFGEPVEVVRKAIDFLCAPDPESRTPTEEGRRLVRMGQYAYRVVNGAVYDKIRNEEARRAQNREAQARFRAKQKPRKTAAQIKAENDGREKRFEAALNNGNESWADEISAEGLPGGGAFNGNE